MELSLTEWEALMQYRSKVFYTKNNLMTTTRILSLCLDKLDKETEPELYKEVHKALKASLEALEAVSEKED